MKKYLSLLVILSISILFATAAEITKELYQQLSQNKNKIPVIQIPKYEKMVLSNGLTVYLAEDHELPVIEVTGYIKGGRMQETTDTAGITDFMLSMMNIGTKKMDEKTFADYKALNGVSFGLGANVDYLTFSGNALMIDAEALLSVMSDVMQDPNFTAPWFKRIKRNNLRGIDQSKTQDASLLGWYYSKTLYPNHPYSFDDDLDLLGASYAAMTSEKLQAHYDATIAPNVTIMTFVGDFKIKEMKKLIVKYFETWQKKNVPIKEIKTPDITANFGKIILVNKPDATQAKIKMGYSFFGWDFPERIPFLIANRIYGSGDFESRLMKKLRVEKGFVYSVYGDFNSMKSGGDYYVFTEVKPANTYETYMTVKDEMNQIKSLKTSLTAVELATMVNLYNAQFPAYYKDVSTVLDNVVFNTEIRPRGKNYLNDYIKKYNSLTADEIQTAYGKFTYPDRFVTIIIGKKEDILPQFDANGITVEVIEIQ